MQAYCVICAVEIIHTGLRGPQRNTCSPECKRARWQALNPPETRRKQRFCVVCHTSLTDRASTCAECRTQRALSRQVHIDQQRELRKIKAATKKTAVRKKRATASMLSRLRDCVVCGVDFLPDKYQGRRKTCSAACRQKRRNEQFKRHDEKRRPCVARDICCAICGVTFTHATSGAPVYCPDHRDYDKNRPPRRVSPAQSRRSTLKYRYQLTVEQYDEMLTRQLGMCAVAGCSETTFLHIDHDHACCPTNDGKTCGKCIRGILCAKCNKAAGLLRDSPAIIRGLADYLSKKEYSHGY